MAVTAREILTIRKGIFAHRGNSVRFPENTLPAFRSAFEIGCDMVETDLHLTADGSLVLWHDERTGRNTEENLIVADSTLARLRELDAGYSFTDGRGTTPFRGMGLYIMTLDELFEEFPVGVFNIDLKSTDPAIADAYAAALARHRAWERVVTGSFNGPVLRRFRSLAPECVTSMTPFEVRAAVVANRPVVGAFAPLLQRLVRGRIFQVPELHGRMRVVDSRLTRTWARAGVPVQVWTVNAPDEAKRLLTLGVRGIFTDAPELMLAELKGFDPDEG